MPDPIVAPDVSTTQPSATPAPDLTPTGAPAQPAPPSNAAVIPGDFTSSGAPQAVPAPNKTNNGIGAGFASAANPQFAADETGNIRQTNPMPQNFKGLLGSVLGGALRGAAYGMAAEKGESGAAAAQRLREQANLQARQQAQQAYENKRQQERDTLNHGLITAQTVSLQQRLAMDEETHAQEMTKLGLENQDLMQKHRANDQGEKDAMSAAKAELIAHGIPPLQELKPDKTASTGSVADLKGKTARSVLAQMTSHAPNIANGKLMPVQNGQDGEDSGIDLYKMEDLNKPITKPFYFRLPTGITNPDGTPVMTNKVITPDGKTTYGDALAQIHGANKRLDEENARLAQQAQQKEAALKQQDEALKPALTQADIGLKKAGAAKDYAAAENLRQETKNLAQKGITVPDNFRLPDNHMQMTYPELSSNLTAQGVKLPEDFDNIYAIGHYKGDDASYPTRTTAKSGQKDRETALHQARTLVNPNLNETTYPAVKSMVKSYANPSNGSAGGNFIAYGTATRHLEQFYKASKALENGDVDALNAVRAYYHLETGSSAPVIYDAIRSALVGELGKTFKGGVPDIPERADIERVISTRSSPDQQQGFAVQEAHAMQSKAAELVNQYYQWTGELPPNAINPTVVQAYQNLGVNPYEGLPQGGRVSIGGTGNTNPTQPGATVATGGTTQLSPEAQAVQNRYKGNLNNR